MKVFYVIGVLIYCRGVSCMSVCCADRCKINIQGNSRKKSENDLPAGMRCST